MKTFSVMVVALLVPVMLTGCGRSPSSSQVDEVNNRVIVRSGMGQSAEIVEAYLADGTRCAALIGGNKGGLTCDWTGPKKGEF
jgi:hypothetical protein